MELYLFHCSDDPRKVDKTLTNSRVYEGALRSECSVISPVIAIQTSENLSGYNYAFIPEFNRYYYIREITSVRKEIWSISLDVDVLMTYAAGIRASTAIVDRQADPSLGNAYIDDASLVDASGVNVQTIAFSGGFSDSPSYILVTAGG